MSYISYHIDNSINDFKLQLSRQKSSWCETLERYVVETVVFIAVRDRCLSSSNEMMTFIGGHCGHCMDVSGKCVQMALWFIYSATA